ncbi:MAG TPA: hypothetical protein VIN67_04650, partial [Desulfobaccales bacterium]
MRTLTHWERRLMAIPNIIECAEMRLMGRYGNEPPIFFGPGQINIQDSTTTIFTMFATPTDVREAFRSLASVRENPYDLDQFRLFAKDFDGNEWACGWTKPKLKGLPKIGWPLTGKINSMLTRVSGPGVSADSGVELVFYPNFLLPMEKTMMTVTSIDGKEIQWSRKAGQQIIQVLDSEIEFFYRPSSESLWVTATKSGKLKHPYLENLLSEPLRILLGQL